MKSYTELHRPQFHFSAEKNWINDPNGLVYKDEVWHLFFQHNPEAPTWGNMTWGHAVSKDLIHWQQLEHALYPDEMGSMFSGSAVVDHANTAGFGEDALLIFYTAAGAYADPVKPFAQCLAYSTDNGQQWKKYSGNPIVNWIEADNRDPKVTWHEQSRQWIMALYLADDRYSLLASADARDWRKIQDLVLEGDTECPDFFPLVDASGTERWVFWGASGQYMVGKFDGEKFSPETNVQICEQGHNGYAAQTWSNAPDGRCIQISWMAGGLFPEMPFNQQLSIPVELKLIGSGDDVTLAREPIRELAVLRGRSVSVTNQIIAPGDPFIADTKAKLFDISLTISKQNSKALYVALRGQVIEFNWVDAELRFGNSNPHKLNTVRKAIALPDGPQLSVRLVVDRTSFEVFLNDGEISASFCYLPDGYIHPLALHSSGGDQVLDNFELHELRSSWE